ncbi:P-loop containing nucleoside triphosphate hydrolase protein [Cokeromyces recurvatus]|uniref:P-loop containing nucleoside triphosphate hydrolase protein n=1 Tax=Cokeromyces recurvatus TaxID=90255 RepID=UPI00221E82E2|nr:P-loop containing nucleoside triphosphate hydrolase protein [Cokeromyces recurvatus]KAI7899717.1 P-loop containing nucleoside triphosphate hydrolase protein [Cokeromyces recurvatus]
MSYMPDTSTAASAARSADRSKRRSLAALQKVKRVRIGEKESEESKQLLNKLLASTDESERKSLAEEAAGFANHYGIRALKACHLFPAISTELFAKKVRSPQALGALELTQALITSNALLRGQIEPHLITLMSPLLELQASKDKSLAELAGQVTRNLVKAFNPIATRHIVTYCLEGLENSKKWQTKMLSLEVIEILAAVNPMQILNCLPVIIPVVSDCMWDTKPDVKAAATKCMTTITALLDNKDIERFIPAVIQCINNPEKVPETIHQLGATTFVQEVDSGTLALMVPLLNRGLRERQTPIKRKSALIIDNMCKLVDDPEVAAPFLPVLLPALEHVHETVADPECRGVVKKAVDTLKRIGGGVDISTIMTNDQKREKVYSTLDKLMPTKLEGFFAPVRKYMAKLALALVLARNFDRSAWASSMSPHAATWLLVTGREHEDGSEELDSSAEKLALAALSSCEEAIAPQSGEEEELEEGEELCNCEFSLAYGAKILLNRTHLRLMRGRRYGLCGANGCGKSTLMRAIANEQVEGFPPRSVLKTVYVEHDIDGSEADTGLVDFILNSEGVECQDRAEIARILKNYGFTDEMVHHQAIGSLSGGWKMKLALARAMLMNADILLLDEPTNHLDVVNVAWLENYLLGLKTVTSIIVSHDSGFLDHVCTDIIHYEGNYKLKRYRGNLSEFVKKVPRAAAYYSLEAAQTVFHFPEPGYLEGIKTKERAILKMKNVDFQYPGSSKKQLIDISMQCSLASRVAVIGPNGAGKSTLIKLLTGELESEVGTVWRHPNLRIAYVAQHAFHHIEKHLDSTPNEYIQWRYATGEDREELDKNDRMNAESNKKAAEQVFIIDGEKRVLEDIVGRRKLKQSYEYEVSWVGRSSVDNTWISRQKLEDMGFGKKIAEVDSAEAAKMGLLRPLTAKEIEKHLAEVGLEPEFASHSHIRGLSGGQKVKLVIGAAMWNRPHMLVLDEPTNYLDRESLGALATAIREYGGGVVIVTHNREFSEALCNEVWKVENGRLTPSGHNWVSGNGTTAIKEEEAEDMVDAQGNTIKATQKKKKLTSKELRKKKKERMERRKRGEEVYTTDEEL